MLIRQYELGLQRCVPARLDGRASSKDSESLVELFLWLCLWLCVSSAYAVQQTQVPETSGSSEVENTEGPAGKYSLADTTGRTVLLLRLPSQFQMVLVSIASTEHSSHRHRPTGPASPTGIPLVPKQAAVAVSLVAAPDLLGEVPASDFQSTINKYKQICHHHVAPGAAVTLQQSSQDYTAQTWHHSSVHAL